MLIVIMAPVVMTMMKMTAMAKTSHQKKLTSTRSPGFISSALRYFWLRMDLRINTKTSSNKDIVGK